MEQINQNDQEQISIVQGYIDHFKNRMNIEMKQPDFEPNATQERDGYDGVNTELNKNLAKMGINKIEIFTSPEQSKRLFDQCTHIKDVQSFHKDQLVSVFISSTRKPYHDISTGKLHDDQTKNLQVEDLLDSRLVAELLLKEKEKSEKIKKTLGYIKDYRKACKEAKNENDLFVEGAKFTEQLINNIGFLGMSFDTEMLYPEKYKNFFQMIGHKPKDRALIKDPIVSGITGGSPLFEYRDLQMVDNQILAKAIVESL